MIQLRSLIVDDEPGMRLSMERALKKALIRLPDMDEEVTFDTRLAGTGAEAMAAIETWDPDLVLLDYKLPDKNGLEILDETRTGESDRTVIMVTAYAALETAVAAVKNGAFDFLAKPFNPKELMETVEKAVVHLITARQVKKLAAERKQVRFQFISVLGHELKSPISAVEGYLNLMQDRALGGSLDAYEDMIGRCLIRTQGMMKLILDLLDLTRLESGMKKRTLDTVNLAGCVQQAVETAQPAAAAGNITLRAHTDPEITMLADPGEIDIILNNLISNAVKYNTPGGTVDISLAKDAQTVEITVRDTGIGMSREDQELLFQEFSRIKNEKTRTITGSGLGLAILQKITRLYGGSISVESEPEKGSTFTVSLRAS